MNNVTEDKLLNLVQQLNEGLHRGNHISEVRRDEHNRPIVVFSVERFKECTKNNSTPLVTRINHLLIYQVSQKKIHQRFFTNHLFSQLQKLQWEEIKFPIVPISGCLLMNPTFCEQWPFFMKYIQNNIKLDIDFHDLELTQILWTVKKILESKMNQPINIYISPCFANFLIVKGISQIPFFFDKEHFLSFIHQNTLILNQRFDYLEYFKELSGQLSFEPFEIDSTEIIDSEALFVDLQLQGQNSREFDNALIKSQLESHNINGSFVQVKPRQFYFIHSLLCKKSKDFHKHIIIFSELNKPKCQYCGIQISVQDFNTLFYDIQFFNQYESFIEMVMSDLQLFLPVVFYFPIFFRIIKENENMYIEYYTLKNLNKVEQDQRIYLLYKLNCNPLHENGIMQNQQQFLNRYTITHHILYEEDLQKFLQEIKGDAMQNDIIEELENDQQQ